MQIEIKDGIARQVDAELFIYADDYWLNYGRLEHTLIARKLNLVRCKLVEKYCTGKILDCGVGFAEFIKKVRTAEAVGYDVNPIAIKWLKDRDLFFDPYMEDMKDIVGVTLFDVLEHMLEPEKLLSRLYVGCFLFISIPIFKDFDNLKMSRHYKKNEHIRYFLENGLVDYIKNFGFELIEKNMDETIAGRDNIGSFVFRKIL